MRGNGVGKERITCLPNYEDSRRETGARGGRRAGSSRVLADTNVGEGEGGRLSDTRSTRKADRNGVTMFHKVRVY